MIHSSTSVPIAPPIKQIERTHTIIRTLFGIPKQARDNRHRLNTDRSFDGEISLVCERSGEVVRADLVLWDERLGDEVLGPLIKEIVLRKRGVRVNARKEVSRLVHLRI